MAMGVTPQQLAEQAAWHESAHTAAYWAQDIALEYVTIVGHGAQRRPHTQPVDLTAGSDGQRLLAYASGLVGTLLYCGQHITDGGIAELLLGASDGRFEVVGKNSGQSLRLPREPHTDARCNGDLSYIDPATVFGEPLRDQETVTFWRDCEHFVMSVLPVVGSVARQLVEHGELAGDEVAQIADAASASMPPAVLPSWAKPTAEAV